MKKLNSVDSSYTVLQVCESIGISIPRFCYHRDLSIAGNCRMCMVEIKNVMKPVVACATSVSKNMYIFTNTELVKIARENVLEFLLINHPLDCPICDQGGECDLQDQTMIYGSDRGRFNEIKRSVEDKDFGPIVKTVMTRCIHCTRCVRYGEEIIGKSILGTMGRGRDTEISTYISSLLHDEMIGNITDICPVGALTLKPYAFRARPWELQNVELVDIFDSLGSSIVMNVKGNEVMRVLPLRNDRLNREWISDKVRFFYEGITVNRLVFPLMYNGKEVVHSSMEIGIFYYVNKLNKVLLKNKKKLCLIGGELDVLDGNFLNSYSNLIGGDLVYMGKFNKLLNVDIRCNWLLNNSLDNFIKFQNMFFINVNLRYESSVLNSLLYKNMNEDEMQKIYYVGVYNKNSYSYNHLGLSVNVLRDIFKGKNEYSNNLLKNKEKVYFLESNNGSILNMELFDYVSSINKFSGDEKNSMGYLAMDSTELNMYEVGINMYSCYEDLNSRMDIGLVHMIGNFNNIDKLVYDCFKLFMSHHMPEKNENGNSFDLYLPLVNFYEVALRNNISVWLNNQLMGVVLFDYLLNSVGESKSNEYYINLFVRLLEYKFSKNIYLQFDTSNKRLIEGLELVKKYKKALASNLLVKIVKNNLMVFNNNVLYKVESNIYYNSSVYIRNSVTLLSAYNIEKNNYILFKQM